MNAIQHFGKVGSESQISIVETDGLNLEDLRRINREVINTRGDLLFANAVVLFEGETEGQALPIFAKKMWGFEPFVKGVSFVGVGGAGNYLPFIRVAQGLHLNWFIFSDGENKTVDDLKKFLGQIGLLSDPLPDNCFVLNEGYDFERYLIECGYENELIEAIDCALGVNGFDKYIRKRDGKKRRRIRTEHVCSECNQYIFIDEARNYTDANGRKQAIYDCLCDNKTRCSPVIAEIISNLSDEQRNIPPMVRSLLERISEIWSV